MTRPDHTDITIVLDRSGSMEAIRRSTIAGFNQFLAEQRKQPGSASISLIQFDDQYEPMYMGIPLAEAVELNRRTFVPRGVTALLDAMGRAIDEAGARLARLPEADRPGHVMFVTITDGLENASQRFNHAQVADRIAHQRDVYQWDFVFLGANQDAIATAASLRMDADAALTYASDDQATAGAWQSLGQATTRSRRARSRGEVCGLAFTDEERRESEGKNRG